MQSQELRLGELRDGDGDNLHDLRDPERGEAGAGVGQEVVTTQDGDLVPILQLQQDGANILVRLAGDVHGEVDHGLMDGLAGVDHLHDLGQLPLFLHDPSAGIHLTPGPVTRSP